MERRSPTCMLPRAGSWPRVSARSSASCLLSTSRISAPRSVSSGFEQRLVSLVRIAETAACSGGGGLPRSGGSAPVGMDGRVSPCFGARTSERSIEREGERERERGVERESGKGSSIAQILWQEFDLLLMLRDEIDRYARFDQLVAGWITS